MRRQPRAVERLSQEEPTECAISVVTLYELFAGLSRAQDPQAEKAKIQHFSEVVAALPLDTAAAEAAANVRVNLERRGQVIGPYDLLIAGHALAANLVLVTNNLREFRRVPDLKIESW